MSKKNLEQLIEERDKLNRQITEQKRKDDTREKVLVGSAFLKAVKEGKIKEEYKNQLLNTYIKSKHDRDFMGLEPLTHHVKVETNLPNNQHSNEQQPQPEYQHQYN